MRQAIQQSNVIGTWPVGLSSLGSVQIGRNRQRGGTLGLQATAGLAQPSRERIAGVALLDLPQRVVLPACHVGKDALQPLSFAVSDLRGVILGAGEHCLVQLPPLQAEQAVGVERRHRFQHSRFIDILSLGVWRQPVQPTRLLALGQHR